DAGGAVGREAGRTWIDRDERDVGPGEPGRGAHELEAAVETREGDHVGELRRHEADDGEDARRRRLGRGTGAAAGRDGDEQCAQGLNATCPTKISARAASFGPSKRRTWVAPGGISATVNGRASSLPAGSW